jgi:PTS system fructose-specific IIC component
MRIRDLLAAESIHLDGVATGKQDILNQMVELMAKSGKISDVETYRAGVFAREEEGTTGIGEGIAIPHCKSDAVKKPGLAAMVVKDGVDFDALDGAPVHLLFLIAAPNTEDNVHLDVLSKLSVLLMDENFTNNLKNAKSVDEFLGVIDAAESEKDDKEEKSSAPAGIQILAVTGCPTGIAHTYMAAEAAFPCHITIGKDGKDVDAKRILGVMGLGVKCGEEIILRTDGEQEEEAMAALSKFLEETL